MSTVKDEHGYGRRHYSSFSYNVLLVKPHMACIMDDLRPLSSDLVSFKLALASRCKAKDGRKPCKSLNQF